MSNSINLKINNSRVKFLLDTGASRSCANFNYVHNILKLSIIPVDNTDLSFPKFLISAGGERLLIKGSVHIDLNISNLIVPFKFLVLENLTSNFIIGSDFFYHTKAELIFHRKQLKLFEGLVSINFDNDTSHLCMALSSKYYRIPPRTEAIINVTFSKPVTNTDCVLLEGIPHNNDPNMHVSRVVLNTNSKIYVCKFMNTSDQQLILRKSTPVAQVFPAEINLSSINEDNYANDCPQLSSDSVEKNKYSCHSLGITIDNDSLSSAEKQKVIDLLDKNADTFATCLKDISGPRPNVLHHKIDTQDHAPIRLRPYPQSPIAREAAEKQIQDLLDAKIIRVSKSPWSAPILMVRKKSPPNPDPLAPPPSQAYRFCTDFRALNQSVKPLFYPLPTNNEISNAIANIKPDLFSTIDLYQAFFQQPLDEESIAKTAFSTPFGHWEYLRSPQGLSSSPANFQLLLSTLFQMDTNDQDHIHLYTLCYADDLLVFSAKGLDAHLAKLQKVFKIFREANLKISPLKSKFAREKVLYLGQEISKDGCCIEQQRIAAMTSLKAPQNQKELRQIFGSFNYLRRFIKSYSIKTQHMNKLLRNDVTFLWSPECQKEFEDIKQCITTAPVLAYFQPEYPKTLHCDASNFAIGFFVTQKGPDNLERPLGYGGRSLNKCETAYTIYEKEFLALVVGMKYFQHYLLGQHFVVKTDHISLKFLNSIKNNNGRALRWSIQLSEFDFSIEHIKGSANNIPDMISRQNFQNTEEQNSMFHDKEETVYSLDSSDTTGHDNNLDKMDHSVTSEPHNRLSQNIYTETNDQTALIQNSQRNYQCENLDFIFDTTSSDQHTTSDIAQADKEIWTTRASFIFEQNKPASANVNNTLDTMIENAFQSFETTIKDMTGGTLTTEKDIQYPQSTSALDDPINFNLINHLQDPGQKQPSNIHITEQIIIPSTVHSDTTEISINKNATITDQGKSYNTPTPLPFHPILQSPSKTLVHTSSKTPPTGSNDNLTSHTDLPLCALMDSINPTPLLTPPGDATTTKEIINNHPNSNTPTQKHTPLISTPDFTHVTVSQNTPQDTEIQNQSHQVINTMNCPTDTPPADDNDGQQTPGGLKISKLNIQQLQLQSPDLKPIIIYLQSGALPQDPKEARTVVYECNNMSLDNEGILYRNSIPKAKRGEIIYNNIAQLVLPTSLRKQLFFQFHDNLGHARLNQAFNLISKKYYFPNFYKHLKTYIETCKICCQANPIRVNNASKAHTHPHEAVGIFSRVHIDILNGLQTEEGNKYMLVLVDSSSKWISIYPMKTMQADEVASKIFDSMATFGIFGSIFTDRGTNFLSKVMQELCSLLNIKQFKTSSARPESNGQVERCNRRILATLRTILDEEKCWDKHIPYLHFCFRSTINTTTNISPFHCLFGTPMNNAFDILLADQSDLDENKFTTQYMQNFRQHLEVLRKAARQNIEDKNTALTDAYDGMDNRQFPWTEGMPCYVYNTLLAADQKRKFRKNNLLGPFYIQKVLGNDTFILRTEDDSKLLKHPIHRNKLVRYNHFLRDPQFVLKSDEQALNFSDSDFIDFEEDYIGPDSSDTTLPDLPAPSSDTTNPTDILDPTIPDNSPPPPPITDPPPPVTPAITHTVPPSSADPLPTTSQTNSNQNNHAFDPISQDPTVFHPAKCITAVKNIRGKRHFHVIFEDDRLAPQWVPEHGVSPFLMKLFYLQNNNNSASHRPHRSRSIPRRYQV